MTDTVYYVASGLLVLGVLTGIALMGRVATAVLGNRISAVSSLLAIGLTLVREDLVSLPALWLCLAAGLLLGLLAAWRVRMIQMPQAVALLNGFGGASSALVAVVAWPQQPQHDLFFLITAALALVIGALTLSGSLLAAAKLHQLMTQKPVQIPGHTALSLILLLLVLVSVPLVFLGFLSPLAGLVLLALAGSLFGLVMALRVGGADMPITLSLLNALSGVAGSIAGMVSGQLLLVVAGSVVGASGLLLTQIMCKAMNRSLRTILLGQTSQAHAADPLPAPSLLQVSQTEDEPEPEDPFERAHRLLTQARDIIVVPGYGMALSQAQAPVRQLADLLTASGVRVRFAIHPVAGRMPGHMNVLLAEVDIPYDDLYEMDDINPSFASCDLALIIGANDVVNPAANTAEGTPIYGMPVLNAVDAKNLIICNYDLKPGYAGVDNPLYQDREKTTLLLGDASQTLTQLLALLSEANTAG